MSVKVSEITRCNLAVSSRFKKNKQKLAEEMTNLLNVSPVVDVHMERLSDGQTNQKRVSLYIETEAVEGTPVMECEWIGNGLEVVHFYITKKRLQLGNNRHLQMRMAFDRKGLVSTEMTLSLYRIIQALPIASDRSEYVKKRISSWESYLRVMERNADVERLEIGIRSARLSLDFRKVTFELHKLPNGFDKFYKKSAVKLVETNQSLGNVVQVQMGKRSIDIELTRDLQEKARTGKWRVPANGKLAFDNVAEMAQINRLKDGFKRLENGWAVNPNLEKLLFEKRPTVRKGKVPEDLSFKQNLNEFQRQAVEGAIAAQDLYVIQGPPGTGKTTVISEICYQHAKMGLKTLVASQSNLAVDNALGKLLTDQDIRILRIGRSESIEEEGQRFVEEQVALYWKQQTLLSIQTHVNQFEKEEQVLLASIKHTETTLEKLKAEIAALETKKIEKIQAKENLNRLQLEMNSSQLSVQELKRKKDQFDFQLTMSQDIFEDAESRYERFNDQVARFSGTGEFAKLQAKLNDELQVLQKQLAYLQTTTSLQQKRNAQQETADQLKKASTQQEILDRIAKHLPNVKKIPELQTLIGNESWASSAEINGILHQMEQLRRDYQASIQAGNHSEMDETLNKAIMYAEQQLIAHQYNMKMLAKKITMMPNVVGGKLEDRYVKKVVDAFRDYAKQKNAFREPLNQADRQKLSAIYEHMVVLKASRNTRLTRGVTQGNEQIKNEILTSFEQLKEVVGQALVKRQQELAEEKTLLKTKLPDLDEEIASYEKTLSDMRETGPNQETLSPMVELEKALTDKKSELEQLGTEESYLEGLVQAASNQQGVLQKREHEMTQIQQSMDELEQKLTMEQLKQTNINKEVVELEEIVRIDIDALLNEVNSNFEKTSTQLIELKRKETFLNVSNDIRLEWQDMLGQSTTYDMDEIKKLYIQYANVIGVTCSISASKDFVTQYPDFDVVIIDEVSKATPPELLLPMLKGKKIILVGDHHQLPPLVGQDTMDEVLEDMTDAKEKADLKSILKESIFERLFNDLPEDSKATLRIQYRMHEHIMETINPFYQENNYGLECGLVDSNKDRDHLLDGKLFKRGQHIIWYDMPNEQGYLEEREQHSRSYYNAAELKQIRELLLDLNQATAQAKNDGRLDETVKKKVGVISFYGEQVKKVDRLLSQELDLPHLHCRTGTVDKFQGMEMDVIILSFVRNHHQKDGNIGFLKDYRRLNVALSRARELLMIVGSADMFTKKAHGESQKAMFQHVLKVVDKYEGLKQLETNTGRK
ncbi:AAA domain-containing protein [Paenisporosarcina sp. NPDC076898]|uniref:DEAD/DEAH box helicase n=1 Tax=unclassified Paenisporosarcina TaxID=2642018 RepID=UPI003D0183B7